SRPTLWVAFLDGLVWRGLIRKSIDDSALRTKLAASLFPLGTPLVNQGELPFESGVPVMMQFSDSIVLAVDLMGQLALHGFDTFFEALDKICKTFLVQGLFLRG